MKIFLLYSFFLGVVYSGCSKENADNKSRADCPQTLIDELKKKPIRNPPAAVYKLTYEGKTFYYVPAYCCDHFSELYDDGCNRLCSPDGGITGKGDGKCPEGMPTFDKIKKELIWKDDRE